MKNSFLLSLVIMLIFFKVSMAHDLEDYVNKGHVEILVEALKYSDAGMFEEAADEIKKTNNENLLLFIKWLKLREGEGSFSEYTEFLKYHEHWPQTRLLKKYGELSIDESVKREDIEAFFKLRAVCEKLKKVSHSLYEDECLPQTANGSIFFLKTLGKNTTKKPAENRQTTLLFVCRFSAGFLCQCSYAIDSGSTGPMILSFLRRSLLSSPLRAASSSSSMAAKTAASSRSLRSCSRRASGYSSIFSNEMFPFWMMHTRSTSSIRPMRAIWC